MCNASDLHPVEPENDLNKYADDTYLLSHSSNSHTVPLELEHISEWACTNNLMLNTSKSMEMIIHRPRTKLENLSVPPPSWGVTRVTSMKILSVTITNTLSFEPHCNECLSQMRPDWICPQNTASPWPQWSSSLERNPSNSHIKTHLCISRMVWISEQE